MSVNERIFAKHFYCIFCPISDLVAPDISYFLAVLGTNLWPTLSSDVDSLSASSD